MSRSTPVQASACCASKSSSIASRPARINRSQVVEVTVEDRAAEARPLHYRSNAQLLVGVVADQLGRRHSAVDAALLPGRRSLRRLRVGVSAGIARSGYTLVDMLSHKRYGRRECSPAASPPSPWPFSSRWRWAAAWRRRARRASAAMGAEHPGRDDRRPGHHRRPQDAERQAPARPARNDVRGHGRLLPALLPITGHVHHRPVRAQPRRGPATLRLVRDEEPQEHPAALAPEGGLPDGARGQVAQRRRARRPRRGRPASTSGAASSTCPRTTTSTT